ncbi:P44/Msp2 family outer membrane protein, partial [Mycobacterium tuberculosis]|nr:P44/Msp2 family outer membrane protein [Mycobacterium tuberculosis]
MTSLTTAERFQASATAVMLNGYVDLGTWYGVTPYVGAGIGAAYVDVAGHSSTTAGSSSADRRFADYETWSLAASASAGASYTITDG